MLLMNDGTSRKADWLVGVSFSRPGRRWDVWLDICWSDGGAAGLAKVPLVDWMRCDAVWYSKVSDSFDDLFFHSLNFATRAK